MSDDQTAAQLGLGDCGNLLDEPTVAILLDKTPWALIGPSWRTATYRNTLAGVGFELPSVVAHRWIDDRDGGRHEYDVHPDETEPLRRLQAKLGALVSTVQQIAGQS